MADFFASPLATWFLGLVLGYSLCFATIAGTLMMNDWRRRKRRRGNV